VQIDLLAIVGLGTQDDPAAPASAVGDRKLAHQAVRTENRSRRGPSQSDAKPGRSAVLVRPRVGHNLVGSLPYSMGFAGLDAAAMLYVRKQTMATIPSQRHWHAFATKLVLAASPVEWAVPILKQAGKTAWIVVDGGYTKKPFLKRVLRLKDAVVVGRLRKDTALRDVPTPPK